MKRFGCPPQLWNMFPCFGQSSCFGLSSTLIFLNHDGTKQLAKTQSQMLNPGITWHTYPSWLSQSTETHGQVNEPLVRGWHSAWMDTLAFHRMLGQKQFSRTYKLWDCALNLCLEKLRPNHRCCTWSSNQTRFEMTYAHLKP